SFPSLFPGAPLGAPRRFRIFALAPRRAPRRHPWPLTMAEARMGAGKFWIVSFIVSLIFLVLTRWLITNEYFFFAGYQVLQFIVLATAWNILGGYTGYTNFGTGAFFAIGAYSAVVLHKLTSLPVPVMMLVGGVMSGIIGFGIEYL